MADESDPQPVNTGALQRAEWALEDGNLAGLWMAEADTWRFYGEAEAAGWWYESKNGNLVRHPAAILYENNRAFANKLAAEFGLNPTAKNKVKAPPCRFLGSPVA